MRGEGPGHPPEIAKRIIASGKDVVGTQRARLRLIEQLLKVWK
jgi:hypothetical protein